jgi:hypothetical protein
MHEAILLSQKPPIADLTYRFKHHARKMGSSLPSRKAILPRSSREYDSGYQATLL